MDKVFGVRMSEKEELNALVNVTINSSTYQSYHRLYINGTSKKVGNPMIDRIQCLYNDAGCKIIYVYRYFENKNNEADCVVAFTPHGCHAVLPNSKVAKAWLNTKCCEELMLFGIDSHNKLRKKQD